MNATRTKNYLFFSADSIAFTMCSNVLGIMPLYLSDYGSPIIVNVFPLPVYPYANIVPLNPSITLSTNPNAAVS